VGAVLAAQGPPAGGTAGRLTQPWS
jgi:hypothetical protein